MREIRKCPVCRGLKFAFACVRGDGKTVMRCTHCGLGILDVTPNAKEIDSIYGKDYFFDHKKEKMVYGYSKRFDGTLFNGSFDEMLLNDIRFLSQKEIQDIKILDVGCAFGQRVHVLRNQGADAWGIDISEEAVSYGQKYRSLNLLCGKIEDIELPANSFDCITMIDVIEHTFQPKQMILKCFDLLKPGGFLVSYTPNFGCFKKVKDEWGGFKKGYEHVLYFDYPSLNYLLSTNGFRVIAYKTVDSLPLIEMQTGKHCNSPIKKMFKKVLNKTVQTMPDKFYYKLRYINRSFFTHPIRWSAHDEHYHLLVYAQKPKER